MDSYTKLINPEIPRQAHFAVTDNQSLIREFENQPPDTIFRAGWFSFISKLLNWYDKNGDKYDDVERVARIIQEIRSGQNNSG